MQRTRSTSSPAAVHHGLRLRLRVERDAGSEPELTRLRDHAREVGAGLVVHRDAVPAGLRDRLEMLPGRLDHQVAVEDAAALVDERRDRLEDDRADRDRLDEVPVADVELEDLRARVHDDLDLLAEPREVRRVERRLDLDSAHPVLPAHGRERRPRSQAPYDMRVPPSGCTSSRWSWSLDRVAERQTVTLRPWSSPRAPMCGLSARIWSWSSFGGRDQSSSRSAGPIFSA